MKERELTVPSMLTMSCALCRAKVIVSLTHQHRVLTLTHQDAYTVIIFNPYRYSNRLWDWRIAATSHIIADPGSCANCIEYIQWKFKAVIIRFQDLVEGSGVRITETLDFSFQNSMDTAPIGELASAISLSLIHPLISIQKLLITANCR